MKFNYKSRKGFTLIELLVVIGILAVLAAIAIPSVAGLIDRANQSSDNTNAKEMTNAIERFTSEYELYCQDVASGALDVTDLDSAQGRVFNVTEIETRKGVEMTENLGYTHDIVAVDRDTKYPVNEVTAKKVIENFMKTSSSTFEPKQSDCSYYYSPQVGKVVVAKTGSTIAELNEIAMEDEAEYATINNGEIIEWINLSINAGKEVNNWTYVNAATPTNNQYKELGTKAPTFNIEWSAKNETTGQPVTVGVSISNSNYSGNGTTPCTMTNVPMGKYALVATYAGNEYKFNLLVYQEGIQTFKLTIPGTNISVGSDNDTYVPSGNGGGTSNPDVNEPPTQSCQHTNTELKNQKDATVLEEGYTGDTWCKDCNTQIATGSTIAKLPQPSNLFSFTLNNRTYHAEEGMTWGEWIGSSYNNSERKYDIEYFITNLNGGHIPSLFQSREHMESLGVTTVMLDKVYVTADGSNRVSAVGLVYLDASGNVVTWMGGGDGVNSYSYYMLKEDIESQANVQFNNTVIEETFYTVRYW